MNTSNLSLPNWAKWAIPIGVILLAVIVYFWIGNNVTNEGEQQQARLSAQYSINQNYLSDCLVKTQQAANIAGTQANKFDEIISDAVKGRYEGGSTAQPVGGQFISALSEAYPDLTSVGDAFERVQTIVVGCRTDYRDMQSTMQDLIAQFNSWRTGSWTTRHFAKDFPNDNLIAQGEHLQPLTGEAAFLAMREVIVTSDTAAAYASGRLDPNDPFPTDTQTTTTP